MSPNCYIIFIDVFYCCSKTFYVIVADSELPRFAEEIQNVTVSVGRDALLACVVDNLRHYKVFSIKLSLLVCQMYHIQ